MNIISMQHLFLLCFIFCSPFVFYCTDSAVWYLKRLSAFARCFAVFMSAHKFIWTAISAILPVYMVYACMPDGT